MAGAMTHPMGIPVASVITERLVPSLPLSTGTATPSPTRTISKCINPRGLIGCLVESRPIWETERMEAAALFDLDEIRSACARFELERIVGRGATSSWSVR